MMNGVLDSTCIDIGHFKGGIHGPITGTFNFAYNFFFIGLECGSTCLVIDCHEPHILAFKVSYQSSNAKAIGLQNNERGYGFHMFSIGRLKG